MINYVPEKLVGTIYKYKYVCCLASKSICRSLKLDDKKMCSKSWWARGQYRSLGCELSPCSSALNAVAMHFVTL